MKITEEGKKYRSVYLPCSEEQKLVHSVLNSQVNNLSRVICP